MAAPTFEKDIFISYAHIDDEALREGDKGWVATFHRSLEVRLAQLMGEKPKIWRDPKLQGNDYFSDEIVQQFPGIATLVSVLSPRYVKSEWCTREVKEFFRAAESNIGIRVKNKARIFKVVKTPIDRSENPPELQNLLGYDFFKRDPETGRSIEYGTLFGSEAEQAYWTMLDDLAHDICDLLQRLRDINPDVSGSNCTTAGASGEDKGTIFLATTSYDIKDTYEALRRDFAGHGYRVLPDTPLPLLESELQTHIGGMLAESAIAIHLVGEQYGIVPEGTDKSVVEIQNESAAQFSALNGLPRFIWIKPGIDVKDERHAEFLEAIRSGGEAQTGADVFETQIDDLKFAIHTTLRKQKEVKAAPSGEAATEALQVYLICDQRDLDSTHEIEDALFNTGFNVVLPVFEGDEAQVRMDHIENLKLCDAVLMYYGAGNELWLRSKQRDLLKIAGYGRTLPLLGKSIVLARPTTPNKERFRSHDMLVINCIEGFTPEQMSDFASSLRKGTEPR